MGHLRYLLIIIFFTNCSGDKVAIQRLKEFEYPLDSLDKGKIFVFKRTPDGEYYYVEQKRVKESGTDFILQETYDTKQRVSAEKYKITEDGKELVESYLYNYPDSLSKNFIKDKGEVYELRNITDGHKYRGTYLELRILTSGNIKGQTIAKETFKREDKLMVNNQVVDVLVFTNDMKVSARHRYIPFFSSESVYTGENIYARQLGLVKYNTRKGDEFFEWELVDIKNLD